MTASFGCVAVDIRHTKRLNLLVSLRKYLCLESSIKSPV